MLGLSLTKNGWWKGCLNSSSSEEIDVLSSWFFSFLESLRQKSVKQTCLKNIYVQWKTDQNL